MLLLSLIILTIPPYFLSRLISVSMKPHGDLTAADADLLLIIHLGCDDPACIQYFTMLFPRFPLISQSILIKEPPESQVQSNCCGEWYPGFTGKGYLVWSLLREKVFPDLHISTKNKIQDSARPEPLEDTLKRRRLTYKNKVRRT